MAYTSCSMTDTRKTLCTNEREGLVLMWTCDKISTYLLGREFTVETNYKPMVPLISFKHLDNFLSRVLRF